MSLLQRMERAQKAKEAAEAAKNGSAAPEASEAAAPTPPETAPVPAAITPVPISTSGNGTKRAPVPVGPANVGPAIPSGMMRPAPTPAREDLMREVRYRLQTEVVGAFKTLLDAKESEVHERIEGLVDRVIAQGGFAVTRDERERLVEEMVHDVTGFGPLEPLLADPTDHRGHGQRPGPHLHRAQGQDPAHRYRSSSTTSTCCGSSTGSSRRSVGGSTSRARAWTRDCPTAHA